MNSRIAANVLSELLSAGVAECCLCPGGRNAPFVALLSEKNILKTYYWYEERSAGFFALGRAQETGKPVAAITTSGTAAGELLPAVMEAYYTGTPLIAITADRPRRFRGTGAPQTAEQNGIFGIYTPLSQDLAEGERPDLGDWDQQSPVHLNVCFEEPLLDQSPQVVESDEKYEKISKDFFLEAKELDAFLTNAENLLVIVSGLPIGACEPVARFLKKLNAPVYLESHSGLREHPDLQEISIVCIEKLLARAEACGYPIESVLRIGGVPTLRLWRDLEELDGAVRVFSINQVPFSGLSWGGVSCADLAVFFKHYQSPKEFSVPIELQFIDKKLSQQTISLFEQFPRSEPSLVHALSKELQQNTHIYLGNSLPIREWDLAAIRENKLFHVTSSRGLNGIDGQISTFLGRCSKHRPNWAVIGDLTALYDLPGPWILNQLDVPDIAILVINNGGGKIFSRMFPYQEFQNNHSFHFAGIAELWNLEYEKWFQIESVHKSGKRFIELEPDPLETEKFWNHYQELCKITPSAVCTGF